MPLNGVPCLAPAFSWTAHTAQGQTLPAAIVDMQIGAGTSPMASYVAFTRVKRAEDLLIFRPFERALFSQGNLEGPELLLRALRGEAIDWQAIEEKHMPSHMCEGCKTKTFKSEFSEKQWSRKDGRRYCKDCERTLGHQGIKKQCQHCGDWLPEDMFNPQAWRKKDPSDVWCDGCKEKRKCKGVCGLEKPFHQFTVSEWEKAARPNNQRGRCKQCMHQRSDQRWCSGCRQYLPRAFHFSNKMWRHTSDKARKCNACSQASCDTEVETRGCKQCKENYTSTFFSDRQWGRPETERTCHSCQAGPRSETSHNHWTCVKCKQTQTKDLFRVWMKDKKTSSAKNCKCNTCWSREVASVKAVAASSQKHVQVQDPKRKT